MPESLLTLSGVHTHIGQYHILQGVDLVVPRGGLSVLLGRNGAGKTTTLRTRLVPLNKKYPIAMLMDACRRYIDDDPRRRITFEYTMLDGVNDSSDQAVSLVRLLGDMPAKVNLIPYNHVEGLPFRCSHNAQIAAFQDVLVTAGILCMTRKTRGSDISAACGQLVGNVMDRVRRGVGQLGVPGKGIS